MLWLLFLALGGVAVWQVVVQTGAGAKRLECTACDLYIMGARPSRGDAILCSNCREFSLFDGQKLVKPDADYVGEWPIYCAELPQSGVQWPSSCAACSQPATRQVVVKLQYEQDASFGRDIATRAATLGMFKAVDRTTISIGIPHCAEHANGAELAMPFERAQNNFGVSFRSYPYYQQFLKLNGATPRRARMFGGQLEE